MLRLTIRLALILSISLLLPACDSEKPAAPPPLGQAMELARAHIEKQEFDQALDVLAPLFDHYATDRELNLAYGEALLRQKRWSRAIWHLQRAAESPELGPEAVVLFVESLAWGGAEEEAIEISTDYLEENPEADGVRLQRAGVLPSVNREEEAVEDLDILLDAAPNNMRLRQMKLDLLEDLDRVGEARELLEEVGEILVANNATAPAQREFCVSRGLFEIRHEDYESAREILDGCLEESPNDPNTVFSMVDLLDAMEKSEASTRLLEEAAARNPLRLRLQIRLAARYRDLDRRTEGEALLEKAATEINSTSAWLSLADYRIAANDVDLAVVAIDKAIVKEFSIGPEDVDFSWSQLPAESAFAFGDIFVRAKQFDRVQGIIDSIDEKAYALLLKARLQLVQGDPKSALATYDEAFKFFPSNPGARYLAAVAAMGIGDFERADKLYQDALRFDSSANDAGLVLARMQHARSLPGAAVDTLLYFMMGHPDDFHGLRLFGRATFELGMLEPSEGARARLDEANARGGIGAADFARDLAVANGPADGLAFLEAHESLFEPGHFELISAWLDIQNALGALADAKKRVMKLVEAHPEAAGLRIVLGRQYEIEGDSDAALASYAIAVERAPNLAVAQLHFARLLESVGRIDEAIEAYDHTAQLDPQDGEAPFAACKILIADERDDEAEPRLVEIVRDHPWHGGAALELSKLLTRNGGDPKRARILAEQSTRFYRVSGPEAHAVLARLQLDAGETSDAISGYRKAIEAGFDQAETRFEFARALAASGESRAAIDELEQAIEMGDLPNVDEAKKLLDELTHQENG
jgi:tetratricopeptide (TPR) repeat protein